MTNLVHIFYVYVEIYQVRILVLDNYQRCPVPLKHRALNLNLGRMFVEVVISLSSPASLFENWLKGLLEQMRLVQHY